MRVKEGGFALYMCMSEVGALEPVVVDLIAARVLNPPEFPTPLPDRPSLAAAAAAELNKREDQAHRPDDVADPAHKLVRHSRCFAQQKPAKQAGRVRGAEPL
jgi:hypothetical protein